MSGRSYLFIMETIALKIHLFLLEARETKNSRHMGEVLSKEGGVWAVR